MIPIRASILAAAALTVVAGCSLGQAKREVAGGATASPKQVLDADALPPKRIYVADFTVDPGAIQPASGLISEAKDELSQRPRLFSGGLLGRIGSSDTPTADQVVDTLAKSITAGLQQQNLGFPVERIAPGTPLPIDGWIVRGEFVSVNPGNRAERAVIGFGAGAASTEVDVDVDRLGPNTLTPVVRFGTQAESSKMPGAAVTLNPYVAAAKFVLGKQATMRDVQDMGAEIAKQLADFARSRGVGTQ